MKSDGKLSLLEPTRTKEDELPGNIGGLIAGALFLSGMTALVYEIVWQRMLVRIVGATLPAVSMIFSIFIGGLALGALFSVPILRKKESPLAVYGFVELALAGFGIGIPLLFGASGSRLFSSISGSVLEGALYVVMLLVPATLVGITFNCVAKHLFDSVSEHKTRSHLISRFYCLNLLGGTFGAFLAVLCLIPYLGLSITSMSMSLVNLCVFFVLIGCSLSVKRHDDPLLELLSWLSPPKVTDSAKPKSESTESTVTAQSIGKTAEIPEDLADGSHASSPYTPSQALFLIAVASAAIMALEVAFTRLLMLLLGSSTYSLGLVLSLVLASFAFGAWIVSRAKSKFSHYLLTQLLCLAAGSMIFVALVTPYVPLAFLLLQQFCGHFLPVNLTFIVPRLFLCACLILPCMIPLGCVFPMLLKGSTAYSQPGSDEGIAWTGRAFACSSIGSIFGSLFGSFILIPLTGSYIPLFGTESGVETTFRLISVLLLILALVTAQWLSQSASSNARSKNVGSKVVAWLACSTVFVFASLILFPKWNLQLLTLGPSFYALPAGAKISQAGLLNSLTRATGPHGLLFYKEGANETVSVEENTDANVRFLKNDGKSGAALPIDWQKAAPTSDAGTHLALGLLPFAFGRAKTGLNALVIGFGSGITSGAILCNPAVTKLTVAELEPAVYQASKKFEPSNLPITAEALSSGRVRLMSTDGRNLLKRSDEQFDVIVSQPSEPWISGASDLFTYEFWQLAKARLKDGGVVCQWIQIYSIDQPALKTVLGTFNKCFNHSLLVHFAGAGEVLLIGSDAPIEPVGEKDVDDFLLKSEQSLISRLSNNSEKAIVSPVFCCDLLLNTDQLRDLTKDIPLNTDDRLRTEYALPQLVGLSDDSVVKNLRWLSVKMKQN
ncbi:MAG TPA: hypothetical protein V6C97_09450 [Oculatellaceae cyanobacterium]